MKLVNVIETHEHKGDCKDPEQQPPTLTTFLFDFSPDDFPVVLALDSAFFALHAAMTK